MGLGIKLRNLFNNKQIEISADEIQNDKNSERFEALCAEEFMVHVAINLIANAISKCEIRTFLTNKEVHKSEYYLWNYQPNKNQNSNEFMHELILKLLYFNEALVFELGGQLFIADGYTQGTEVIQERTFYNISRGAFSIGEERKITEVLYFKLNNKSVRQLLLNLCESYNELMTVAYEKFSKSGGEKGVLTIDAAKVSGQAKTLDKSFDEIMDDMMNNRFKKFFNSRNAVMPLFQGYSYESKGGQEATKKATSELKDITDIDDRIVIKVANAFNIPVQLLKGDIADVEKITHNFLTFCIDPIVNMLQTEINRKRNGKNVLKGTYVLIDTKSILHTDLFAIAEKIDKLISSGMYSIDELRKYCGDIQLNTNFSTQHFITKNYETMKGENESDKLKDDVSSSSGS